jgi:hypothetical protein
MPSTQVKKGRIGGDDSSHSNQLHFVSFQDDERWGNPFNFLMNELVKPIQSPVWSPKWRGLPGIWKQVCSFSDTYFIPVLYVDFNFH